MRPKSYTIVCHSSDKARWLYERTQSIGASDRLTPGLIKDKLGLTEPFFGNRKMIMGSILEQAAIAGFQTWSSLRTRPSGVMVRSREFPFMHATLDGLCMIPRKRKHLQFFLETEMQMNPERVEEILAHRKLAILEVKVPDIFSLDKWAEVRVEQKKVGKDVLSYHSFERIKAEPPKAYMMQVQHQLAVTGLDAAWLVAMIGAKVFVAHHIRRNEEMIADRILRCAEMWQHIQKAKEAADELAFEAALCA